MSPRAMAAVAVAVGAMLAGRAEQVRAQRRDTGGARLARQEVRYRVGLEEQNGWFVRLDDDSLVVDRGRGPVAIPRAQLVTMDVRRSSRSAAIIGGVVGALAGGAFGAAAECTSSSPGKPDTECSKGEKVAWSVVLSGLAGGAGAWYLGHHPGWRRVLPASGVPGPVRLAGETTAPPAPPSAEHPAVPPAAEHPAVTPGAPPPAALAETARPPAPTPAPEMRASALLGRWVRVIAGAERPREGPVLGIDPGWLVLARNGHPADTVRIARAAISELWVSRADRPMTGEGTYIGAIPGGIAGLGLGVLGIQAILRKYPNDLSVGLGGGLIFPFILLGGAAVGAGAGALVGGLIGAHTMHRDWQTVVASPQVTLQPVGVDRVAVTVRLGSGPPRGRDR